MITMALRVASLPQFDCRYNCFMHLVLATVLGEVLVLVPVVRRSAIQVLVAVELEKSVA